MVYGDYYTVQCRCRLAPAERDIWDDKSEWSSLEGAIKAAQVELAAGRVVRIVDPSGVVIWSS
jgi:hypothetical protein